MVAVLWASVGKQDPLAGGLPSYSWVKPGAYAYYSGTGAVGGISYNSTFLWKILKVDGTRALVFAEYNITAPGVRPSGPEKTSWISIQPGAPPIALMGDNSMPSVSTTYTIKGTGVPVTIYYDGSDDGKGTAMAMDVDMNIGLPLEIALSVPGVSLVTCSLVQTNIPGLFA